MHALAYLEQFKPLKSKKVVLDKNVGCVSERFVIDTYNVLDTYNALSIIPKIAIS
jgi:hypothetical protein